MGGKRNRAGQYLFAIAAGLIVAMLAGCASLEQLLKEHEGRAHLEQGRLLVRQGDFQGGIRENGKAIAAAPKSAPAAAALLGTAFIEADPANPGRDLDKSLALFREVVSGFPDSDPAREASTVIPLLEEELSAEHAARLHLERMQHLAGQGHFEEALRENDKLLLAPNGPIADAALFSQGLLAADPANPNKDYRKALALFTRLVTDFPGSRYADRGRIWCAILKEQFSAQREASALLERVRLLIRQDEFDKALRECERMPGDAALFGMALVHADRSNPRLDYRRALGLLSQLEREFPQSPLAADARVWSPLLRNTVSAEWEGHLHLQRMRGLIRKGDFEGAQRESQKLLTSSAKGLPEDAALFALGLVYVDQANPKKDYRKALSYFSRLRKEYPASQFLEEAKIWTGVLETMEKSLRVDLEIEEKKHELRR